MQTKRHSTVLLALFLLAALVCIIPVQAQQATASITGTVTDPSGAPVANATIVARDVDRGTTTTVTTNGEGQYNIPQLPVGSYEIRVTQPGFQTSVHPPLTLVLNQVARLNFQLQVGQVNQTVEVTAAAPALQTETTQLNTVIESKTITDLPLASRNYVQLTLLAPGAITTDPSGFTNGITTGLGPGGGDASRPYINGNLEQSNNFLLDGMDNNQVSDNLVGYTPNADAIQEFNVITNNASAEFGNFQGGIINATIKSGTNQFHGDAFEFFRNDKLNANNWANNWQGVPKSPLRWNQFGGVIGGPIKKDKLFFFADYQGERVDYPPATGFITVMTAAERNGDFSQLLTLKNPIQLKNPFTGQPFPGNIIPSSMIDPVAKNLFASGKYPLPINGNLTNNYLVSNGSAINQDQGDIKIDYNIGENDRLYARYSRLFANDPSTNSFPLSSDAFTNDNAHNGVINWTHTFGPTLVNELRAGVNYILVNNGNSPHSGLGNFGTSIGIANANIAGPGLLALNFSNGFASGLGSSIVGNQQLFASTVGELDDTVVWTKGRHTLHMGYQIYRERMNVYYAGNAGNLGSLSFSGQYSGLSESDFFLGLPSGFGGGSAETGTWGQRSSILAGFIQDDFHVSSNLTLNLGLRYENHTPWVEVKNRQGNFGLINGQEYFAGQSGCPYNNCKALYNSYNGLLNWQPRVGFAYTTFGGKTVLRGAYSVSSYLQGTGTNLRLTMNPPYRQPNFSVSYPTSQPLPSTTTEQGLIPPPPGDPFVGAELRVWDPNFRPAGSQQWNFSIQQQFTPGTTLTVSYVGQHGTGLPEPLALNEGVLHYGPGATSVTNPNGFVTPSPYLAGNPALKSKIGPIAGTAAAGSDKYHALQVSFQKRYAAGLQFQVAYTYSKCMTDNGGYYGSWGAQAWPGPTYWQNVYDGRSEWGPCFYDQQQNLTSYALYELPYGKGRKFGGSANGVAQAIAGGWNVTAILTDHTGFPMTPYTWSDTAGTGITNLFWIRADCIGPAKLTKSNYSNGAGTGGIQWFDPSAFAEPANNTFGNCGNGVVRSPGYNNIDVSVMKNFNFTESKYVQFRSDFINATNSTHLNAPGLACATGTTGPGGLALCNGGGTGLITSAQPARTIQLALKFYF